MNHLIAAWVKIPDSGCARQNLRLISVIDCPHCCQHSCSGNGNRISNTFLTHFLTVKNNLWPSTLLYQGNPIKSRWQRFTQHRTSENLIYLIIEIKKLFNLHFTDCNCRHCWIERLQMSKAETNVYGLVNYS